MTILYTPAVTSKSKTVFPVAGYWLRKAELRVAFGP